MRLDTAAWSIEPASVASIRSSWFDDPALFPPGSAELDGALVMRRVPVEWHAVPGPRTARVRRPAPDAACG